MKWNAAQGALVYNLITYYLPIISICLNSIDGFLSYMNGLASTVVFLNYFSVVQYLAVTVYIAF